MMSAVVLKHDLLVALFAACASRYTHRTTHRYIVTCRTHSMMSAVLHDASVMIAAKGNTN